VENVYIFVVAVFIIWSSYSLGKMKFTFKWRYHRLDIVPQKDKGRFTAKFKIERGDVKTKEYPELSIVK